MITGTTYSSQVLQETLIKTFAEVRLAFSNVKDQDINIHPNAKSWSVAQVLDHLTKSNRSITKALKLEGSQINRDPSTKVNELRDIFLDFGKKFEAPDFIRPSENLLEKEEVIRANRKSCDDLLQAAGETDLTTMINHPAFGDITKLEILHFVLFHSVRHHRQIENIIKSFNKN